MFEKQWHRFSLISIWYETNPDHLIPCVYKRNLRMKYKKVRNLEQEIII